MRAACDCYRSASSPTDDYKGLPCYDDAGGWLHIHENVLDADEGRWVEEEARERLQDLVRRLPGRALWFAHVR